MNDADANEDAARRIQEQIWMAEAAEGGADDDDDDADGDNNDNNNNNNGAGAAVQDFVRQLLDRNDNDGNNNNNGGAGDNNNDNAAAADDDVEDDDDDDDEAAENRRGSIDGGIAGEVRDENSIKIIRSLKCPLVLYFECADDLDELFCPNNPMLKKGTRVCIGLDKNTKLSVVFEQYCKFVNSKIPKNSGANAANVVKMTDFEFLHCTLLDPNMTVEGSAMMKNDRIKVYRERSKDRASTTEVLRLQRESDRKYFKDLRQLLPNPSPEHNGCDVVLDCRGKVMDERGYSQHVLATTVRANSVQISKRCKWLGRKIADAREDIRRRVEMTIPSYEDKSDFNEDDAAASEGVKSGQSDLDDEDDIIMAEPGAQAGGNNNIIAAGGDGSAAKVEDDDDDDEPAAKVMVAKAGRSSARKSESRSSSPNSVWITLDHSPQAVKLLLEHCYTNRVQSLGLEAFLKSSKFPNPKETSLAARQSGPVPPFRKHEWPDGGSPTVSLHLALAGITLAEEAHMPRLSLMCEIAASLLVDKKNVIDVLSACQMQQQKTGNRLPILRKRAMLDCIMANGSNGIDHLYANPNFKSSLNERCGLVIPSLLDGTVEIMPTNMDTKVMRKKKDRMALERKKWCELADNADKNKRIMERIKYKDQVVVARRMEVAFGPDERGLKTPSKNIWRENRENPYKRDPPPSLMNQGGRGTKRKGASSRSAAGAGTETTRSVRRRVTRKKNS